MIDIVNAIFFFKTFLDLLSIENSEYYPIDCKTNIFYVFVLFLVLQWGLEVNRILVLILVSFTNMSKRSKYVALGENPIHNGLII